MHIYKNEEGDHEVVPRSMNTWLILSEVYEVKWSF